ILVGGILLISCVIGTLSQLDLEFFLKLANSVFVLVYMLAMLAAFKLLRGFGKTLAGLSLLLCTGVFICLGWSMFYALGIFTLLLLPWKQWRHKRQTRVVE
ncbi:L-methionine/branched-chain amino acid transporter, partial [Vibrio parahaemolyticus]|nr:L-methionine/branched-chain amino acid transporter [Vibrio parahaemolyticus]NMR83657.1 L-methionine/branched-chain amino acid transporter [Vibrio parahaemolyticus]